MRTSRSVLRQLESQDHGGSLCNGRGTWWDSHFISLDYGFGKSSASAHLHVRIQDGKLNTIAEFVAAHLPADEFAREVVNRFVLPQIQGQRRRILAVYLDPSNFKNIGNSSSTRRTAAGRCSGSTRTTAILAHRRSDQRSMSCCATRGSGSLTLYSCGSSTASPGHCGNSCQRSNCSVSSGLTSCPRRRR